MVKRFSIILTLVVCLVWYANVTLAQQLVEEGLVSYWSFDKAAIVGKTV